MTILHRFIACGAFVAGDTHTGRTCYAYETSPNAVFAKRKPEMVAENMLSRENECGAWRDQIAAHKAFDAANWKHLTGLQLVWKGIGGP
jgi:hypothetical protein